jgi:hypothetical protein
LDAWTGNGTASETWGITVVETPKVYFATAKLAAQTITVGGTDAALVTQAAVGATVDGSTASATLSVFTVDTGAWELIFEGGTRTFTLTVSETGKISKTIAVTLNVTPNLTGVAVFKVDRGAGVLHSDLPVTASPAESEAWARAGSLTRITGIQEWQIGATYQEEGSWGSGPGSCLLDALAWVDRNADENEEYLIRVEKNESLTTTMVLTANANENVKIRLRGIGQERIINYGVPIPAAHWDYRNHAIVPNPLSNAYGLINIRGSAATLMFSLENYITLQGIRAAGVTDMLCPVVGFGNSSIIMEAGSKITGEGMSRMVFFNVTSSVSNCKFIMRGGEITNNVVTFDYVIYFNAAPAGTKQPRFIKTGGSITGNTKPDGTPINNVIFGINEYNIEPNQPYDLP